LVLEFGMSGMRRAGASVPDIMKNINLLKVYFG
jgi:hypothetical protein